MKRLLLSIAFAIVAASPAVGEDVPFGIPPLPAPGQPSVALSKLADIMGTTQTRHIKLWYAIKSRNWDLLNYELGQIKDSFENAVIYYHNIPIDYIVAVERPLVAMAEAAKSKNGAKLEGSYAELTTACNNCHQAAQIGFIVIQTPTYSPFSDQKFLPGQK